MPTNFGALPTDQPVPVAHAARSFAWVGNQNRVNNLWAVGTPLPNGVGGFYQLSVTPPRRCYWVVGVEMLWTSPDIIWSNVAVGVRLNPADLDGVVIGNYLYAACHGSLPWRTYQSSYPYRLEGGVTYTATLTFEGSSNNNQDYYYHPNHQMMTGVLVGEGVV